MRQDEIKSLLAGVVLGVPLLGVVIACLAVLGGVVDPRGLVPARLWPGPRAQATPMAVPRPPALPSSRPTKGAPAGRPVHPAPKRAPQRGGH